MAHLKLAHKRSARLADVNADCLTHGCEVRREGVSKVSEGDGGCPQPPRDVAASNTVPLSPEGPGSDGVCGGPLGTESLYTGFRV